MTHCKLIAGQTVCMITGYPQKPFCYDKGYRFCAYCDRIFMTDKIFCPCCGTPLRIHPRGKKGKEKLKMRVKSEHKRLKFKTKDKK